MVIQSLQSFGNFDAYEKNSYFKVILVSTQVNGCNLSLNSLSTSIFQLVYILRWGLPWWLSGKESTFKAGATRDSSLIPGLGRSPGGGHGNPLQHYCRGNPIDRVTWWATVHGVAKSWTCLCMGMGSSPSQKDSFLWDLEAYPYSEALESDHGLES